MEYKFELHAWVRWRHIVQSKEDGIWDTKNFFFREYNSITLTTLRNPPKKYRERNSSPIPVPDLKYVSETK